jgi:hypothetical protein
MRAASSCGLLIETPTSICREQRAQKLRSFPVSKLGTTRRSKTPAARERHSDARFQIPAVRKSSRRATRREHRKRRSWAAASAAAEPPETGKSRNRRAKRRRRNQVVPHDDDRNDDGRNASGRGKDVPAHENAHTQAAGADRSPAATRSQRPSIQLGRQIAERKT